MIAKKDLIHGGMYDGEVIDTYHRMVATWNANIERFIYPRHKFGLIFQDEMKHLEDETRFQAFAPLERLD